MFSTIVTVIFAVYVIYDGRDLEAEKKSSYDALVKCTQTAWDADASDLRAKGGHINSAEKVEKGCIFLRVRFTRQVVLLSKCKKMVYVLYKRRNSIFLGMVTRLPNPTQAKDRCIGIDSRPR